MVTQRKYRNPPLVEAVFELFARVAPAREHEFDPQTFFVKFEEFVSEPFPVRRATVGVAMREGELQATTHTDAGNTERRWNKDRSRAVLVGPNLVAYNVLPPYENYVEHRPTLEQLLNRYIETARPESYDVLGHRYLNRLHTTKAPSELLSIYPTLPAQLGADRAPFSLQAEVMQFEGGSVFAIVAQVERKEELASYVLDLYARSSVPLQGWGVTEMLAWHDRAHDAVSDVFELAITHHAREEFGVEA